MNIESMHYKSSPAGALQGDLTVPGDKSISHRAVLLGAIASGTTTIQGFLHAEDCMATVKAMQAMGVHIEHPIDNHLIIHGVGKYGLQQPTHTLDCGNSGTGMRLLAGVLVGQSFDSILDGDHSLRKRPMARISRPLIQMGADISTCAGKPPLTIRGRGACLQGICYTMPEASAQVKSCVLLAGMYAQGETTVRDPGNTRDHTERLLTTFSYPIQKGKNHVTIHAQGACVGTDIVVPGDLSSAAFLIVAASIVPGSDVVIRGVGINPTRTGVLHILQNMGANIQCMHQRMCGGEPVADIRVRYAPLAGIDIPAALVPSAIDECPILCIAAACARGHTTLQGARELRVKESDRIAMMAAGLQQLGIQVQILEEGMIVQGGSMHGGTVQSAGDHRIAMAFAVAGAVATEPVVIRDCINVRTSFPTFLTCANQIQMRVEAVYRV